MDCESLSKSLGLPQWLFEFGVETITQFNIDWSHGMDHAIKVLTYARQIVACYRRDCLDRELIPGLPNAEAEKLIDVAALVHDWIDKKYMVESVGAMRLESRFSRQNFPYTRQVLAIITSISFSKRVARKKQGLPMIDLGPLQLAAEIVADADMLDAYDPERCLVFQSRFNYAEERQRQIVKEVLVDRVLQYRDHYMHTPYGREMAKPLHDKLVVYVRDHGFDM
jgi:hypothetical protein